MIGKLCDFSDCGNVATWKHRRRRFESLEAATAVYCEQHHCLYGCHPL